MGGDELDKIITEKTLTLVDSLYFTKEVLGLEKITEDLLKKDIKHLPVTKNLEEEDLWIEEYEHSFNMLKALTLKYLKEINIDPNNLEELFILPTPEGYKVKIILKEPIKVKGKYITTIIINHLEQVKSMSAIVDSTTMIIFKPVNDSPSPLKTLVSS